MSRFCIVAGVLVIGACVGEEPAPLPGAFELRLTDAPLDGVDAVNVTIARVDVNFLDDREPITIRDEPITLDLLQLQDGITEVIAYGEMPAGMINQIRLVISEASVVQDGVEEPLKIPSGAQTGLKLPVKAEIVAGNPTTVVLDMDAARSLRRKGGRWHFFRPVVSVVIWAVLGLDCDEDDKWDDAAFPVRYFVNEASFESMGFVDSVEVVRAASDMWRTGTGSIVDFTFGGTTTATNSNPDCIPGLLNTDGLNVIDADEVFDDDPNLAAMACVVKSSVTSEILEVDVSLYRDRAGGMPRNWIYDESADVGSGVDFFRVVEHEFGHVLGICHPGTQPDGTIDPDLQLNSVMHASSATPRTLQVYDVNSVHLRYPVRPEAPIKALVSQDGLTWQSPVGFTSPGDSPYGFGAASGPGSDEIVLVFIDTSGGLVAVKGDGTSWTSRVVIGGAAPIGPHVSLTYGDTPTGPRYVLTYTEFVLQQHRKVVFRTSSADGVTWTFPQTLETVPHDLPCGAAFSTEAQRFACMMPRNPPANVFQGTYVSADAQTWDFTNEVFISPEAPGLACAGLGPSGGGFCLAVGPDNGTGARYRFSAAGGEFVDDATLGRILDFPVVNSFKGLPGEATAQRIALAVRPADARFVAAWRGLTDLPTGRDIFTAVTVAPGLDGGTWTDQRRVVGSEVPPALVYNAATDRYWLFFAQ